MRASMTTTWYLLGLLLASPLAPARADVPVSGMPVPELVLFDTTMQDYMQANDIGAGVLGVMKDGRIVYLRGFGWQDQEHTTELPENAMMRLASVTKPITAAAINHFMDAGVISYDQFVFDLGQAAGGILDYEPFPGPGVEDLRLAGITVWSLLHHHGGWDRNAQVCDTSGVPCDECVIGETCGVCNIHGGTCEKVGDLTRREIDIWNDMQDILAEGPPPGREATVRWIMGQPLQVAPGQERHYSNIGYLILGLILKQTSGTEYIPFVRQHVLTGAMWFPAGEFAQGHTFERDANPREPWYDCPTISRNVFDPDGDSVVTAYGGWDHEARIAQGGLIASAVPLLRYLDKYCVNDSYEVRRGAMIDIEWDWGIGTPRTTILGAREHGGRLQGTNTLARQRSDGINYVILLNKRVPDDNQPNYVDEIKALLEAAIDDGSITWPSRSVDGVWMDFAHSGVEQGCYDKPLNSIDDLSGLPPYSKVRIKEGSTGWEGTIGTPHMLLTGVQGSSVIIGQ